MRYAMSKARIRSRNPYIRKIIEERYKELYALYPYNVKSGQKALFV